MSSFCRGKRKTENKRERELQWKARGGTIAAKTWLNICMPSVAVVLVQNYQKILFWGVRRLKTTSALQNISKKKLLIEVEIGENVFSTRVNFKNFLLTLWQKMKWKPQEIFQRKPARIISGSHPTVTTTEAEFFIHKKNFITNRIEPASRIKNVLKSFIVFLT